jgi:hypothetical protein
MSRLDLEQRYGPMVPLSDLAVYFHAAQRAVRRALEAREIPILEFGSSAVVPLRLVEAAFGLDLLADPEAIRHDQARWNSMYRADGSPKPPQEYLAEVRTRADKYGAAIKAARRGRADSDPLIEPAEDVVT